MKGPNILAYLCVQAPPPPPRGINIYVPRGLTLKKSTRCSLFVECIVRISEQTAAFAVHVIK
jgi:hypothetical protein